jgi:hypothetical protein
MILLYDVANVAHDVARRDRAKPGGDEVTKDFDVIEHAGNGQLNGVTMGFIRSARWVCAQSASRSNGLI